MLWQDEFQKAMRLTPGKVNGEDIARWTAIKKIMHLSLAAAGEPISQA